jgi:dTDP-4-amino-4,6-dideoxygalactose transaminase
MIPFFDLRPQHEPLRRRLYDAAARVLDSGRYVSGREVAAFEEAFAAKCGTAYGTAVNSGTSALHLALLAAGVRPGDEVITVPFTFVATVAAIRYAGACPVLVDVDPDSYTMDVRQLRRAITERTRAIVPVHLYGQVADMDPILEVARRHGIVVIEDACQAHGATYKGRPAGSLGDLACFSFYPSKNLGACGEGGAVVTNNRDYDRVVRRLRDWGQEAKYSFALKGYNYRMEELQAAFLSVKLPFLDEWNESRREVAGEYRRRLEGTPIEPPKEMAYGRHVYHVYAVRVKDRVSVRWRLERAGVETGVHYPEPVHLIPAYADLGYSEGEFPVSERLAREELSLPIFPFMPNEHVDEVTRALRAITCPSTAGCSP